MRNCHNDKPGVQIRSKLWLEVDGDPVFGRGRRLLLDAIDKHGSISQAARSIDVSYRKAWSYISSMEKRLGMQLVVRRAGGRNGGGASLTDSARDFILKYEKLERGIMELVDKRYIKVFGRRAKSK